MDVAWRCKTPGYCLNRSSKTNGIDNAIPRCTMVQVEACMTRNDDDACCARIRITALWAAGAKKCSQFDTSGTTAVDRLVVSPTKSACFGCIWSGFVHNQLLLQPKLFPSFVPEGLGSPRASRAPREVMQADQEIRNRRISTSPPRPQPAIFAIQHIYFTPWRTCNQRECECNKTRRAGLLSMPPRTTCRGMSSSGGFIVQLQWSGTAAS